MFSSNPYQSQGREDCCGSIKRYIGMIPFGSKCICMTLTIVSIINLVLGSTLLKVMVSVPPLTIMQHQYWRIISAPWIFLSLLNGILDGLMFLCIMPDLERRIGTAKFLLRYVILGLLFQIPFTGIGFALSNIRVLYDAGLLFAYLTQFSAFCFRNPNSTVMCCMIVPIKAVFLPFVYLLMSALFGQIPLRELLCIILAFFDSKDWLEFTVVSSKLARYLDRAWFSPFRYFKSYIKCDDSYEEPGIVSSMFQQNQPQQRRSSLFSSASVEAQKSFQTFSGEGISLQKAIEQREKAQEKKEVEKIEEAPDVTAQRDQMSQADRQRLSKSILIKRFHQGKLQAQQKQNEEVVEIEEQEEENMNLLKKK